jgi:hypothetical protein
MILRPILLAALLTSGAGPLAAGAARAATQPEAPFARVFLALRGCTSCSHCRTTIRQMVNAEAAGGVARVKGDQVEVSYPKPATVPLRAVIRNLAENRLHDLSVVDVLFEAEGTIAADASGTGIFRLERTGQSFPVRLDRSIRIPADGSPVRLVALVEGWRGKGDLTLTAREVRTSLR